jgi:hypothetical protein
MKQTCIFAAIALAAFAVAFHHGSAAPLPPPVPEKRQVDQWEYGRLRIDARYAWTTATEELVAENRRDLAEKLKAMIPEKCTEGMIALVVLDRLGSQGWEIIAIDRNARDNFLAVYHFKRRRT